MNLIASNFTSQQLARLNRNGIEILGVVDNGTELFFRLNTGRTLNWTAVAALAR